MADRSVPAARATGPRRVPLSWIALLVVAGLAWVLTVLQARDMGNGPGTMGLALPLFLAFWIAMMAAMMLPSVAPVALLWTRSIAARSTGYARSVRTAQFLGGYLLAWSAYGVAAFVVLLAVERALEEAPGAGRWLGLAIFGTAGVYQLTPLKNICLSHCRSPMVALLHYAGYRGRLRDLRIGLHHGAYCVGCCWGIMLVLVAVGVMNVAAMAVIAGGIAVEKLWRHGATSSRVIGVAFLVLAVLAFAMPDLLPGLHMDDETGAM